MEIREFLREKVKGDWPSRPGIEHALSTRPVRSHREKKIQELDMVYAQGYLDAVEDIKERGENETS